MLYEVSKSFAVILMEDRYKEILHGRASYSVHSFATSRFLLLNCVLMPNQIKLYDKSKNC